MGLDAAFIVVSKRYHLPIQVRTLRKEHTIHAIMTKGRDRDYEQEFPLECAVMRENRITDGRATWHYYTYPTDEEIERIWGSMLIEINTDVFTVREENDVHGRPQLERLVLAVALVDWYYPGLGDTLVYAWSE